MESVQLVKEFLESIGCTVTETGSLPSSDDTWVGLVIPPKGYHYMMIISGLSVLLNANKSDDYIDVMPPTEAMNVHVHLADPESLPKIKDLLLNKAILPPLYVMPKPSKIETLETQFQTDFPAVTWNDSNSSSAPWFQIP